jgi:hypothetical protein
MVMASDVDKKKADIGGFGHCKACCSLADLCCCCDRLRRRRCNLVYCCCSCCSMDRMAADRFSDILTVPTTTLAAAHFVAYNRRARYRYMNFYI